MRAMTTTAFDRSALAPIKPELVSKFLPLQSPSNHPIQPIERGGGEPPATRIHRQEACTVKGIRIGDLLVEQGVLSRKQVDHVLQVQKMSHRPFGDLAERLYGIDPKAIEDAWVEQYVRIVGVVDL